MGTFRILAITAILALCVGHSLAAENTLVLGDGLSVRVLYFEPEDASSPPPLAILFAGGLNNEFMARAQFWLGREMVTRGWAIAVPISDQGRKFFIQNSSLIPEIADQLADIYSIKEQPPLLLGISSGGSAALAVAAQEPGKVLGVMATPGRILEEVQLDDLANLPVYLRVGEQDDFRWNRNLEDSVAQLERAGARVDAALVPGAHHIFTLDWDEIENWLKEVLQSADAQD